jgi:hypothetical protein
MWVKRVVLACLLGTITAAAVGCGGDEKSSGNSPKLKAPDEGPVKGRPGE